MSTLHPYAPNTTNGTINSSPYITSSELLDPSKPRVLFTGLQKHDSEFWSKVLMSLGVQIVDNWRDCNILITDRGRRTTKYLACVAANKLVVNVTWADRCRKSHRLVGEYLIFTLCWLKSFQHVPAKFRPSNFELRTLLK